MTLLAAARVARMSYARLRFLAVDRREFTVIRDVIGKGVQLYLLRNEVAAFGAGALTGLREFRGRMVAGSRPGEAVQRAAEVKSSRRSNSARG
jgi:hypothetical protein